MPALIAQLEEQIRPKDEIEVRSLVGAPRLNYHHGFVHSPKANALRRSGNSSFSKKNPYSVVSLLPFLIFLVFLILVFSLETLYHVLMQKFREKFQKLSIGGVGVITLLVFIFTIPFQKRIEFLNIYSHIYGSFIDYTTILLYVNDALLVAALAFLAVHAVRKRNNPLSGISKLFPLFIGILLLSQLLTFFSHRSDVAWSFFFQIVLVSLFGLAIYILTAKSRTSALFLIPLVFAGVYESIIGILQFALQHSLGLKLLGESPFDITTINVAKIVVAGDTYLRAYGTFPHPNVFAAFLGTSISASILLMYIGRARYMKNILKTALWLVFILIQATALVLTFSRTGWLGSAISLGVLGLYFVIRNERKEDDIEMKNKLRAFFAILIVAGILITLAFWPFVSSRGTIEDAHGDFATSERSLLINVSRETIERFPLTGTGLHSFLDDIAAYSDRHSLVLPYWQYQPAHNIYLLIASEAGLIGLLGFLLPVIFMLIKAINALRSHSPRTIFIIFGISNIASYLVIGFFDHHPWDIHQSQLLFWLLLGFTVGSSEAPSAKLGLYQTKEHK